MERRRHTPEQIIRNSGGRADARRGARRSRKRRRSWGSREQTYHRWRSQYGGMKADDAKRLKEPERENGRLKATVADQPLENRALKEIAKRNW